MKNIILMFVLLLSFTLYAQDKNESSKMKMDDETNAWMNKISSDSEMRITMMDMMIEKASLNKEEMMKLANSVLSNSELSQMIISKGNEKADRDSFEPKSRGMMNDSVKNKKMTPMKPVLRK